MSDIKELEYLDDIEDIIKEYKKEPSQEITIQPFIIDNLQISFT